MFNPKEYTKGSIKRGHSLSDKLREVLSAEKGTKDFQTKYAEFHTHCTTFIEQIKTLNNTSPNDVIFAQIPQDLITDINTHIQSFTDVTAQLFPDGDAHSATEFPAHLVPPFTSSFRGILMCVSTLSKIKFSKVKSSDNTDHSSSTETLPNTEQQSQSQQQSSSLEHSSSSSSSSVSPTSTPKLTASGASSTSITNSQESEIEPIKRKKSSLSSSPLTTTLKDSPKLPSSKGENDVMDRTSSPRHKSIKERIKARRSLKSMTFGSGKRAEALESMLAVAENSGNTPPVTAAGTQGTTTFSDLKPAGRKRSGSLTTIGGNSAARETLSALEALMTAVWAHKVLCEGCKGSIPEKRKFLASKELVKKAYDEYLKVAKGGVPEIASDEKCQDLFNTFFTLSGPYLSSKVDDDVRDQYLVAMADILTYKETLGSKIQSKISQNSGISVASSVSPHKGMGGSAEDDSDENDDDDYCFEDFRNEISDEMAAASSSQPELMEALRKKDAEIADLRRELDAERAAHKDILQRLDAVLSALSKDSGASGIDPETLKALEAYAADIAAKEKSLAEARAALKAETAELERRRPGDAPPLRVVGIAHREKEREKAKVVQAGASISKRSDKGAVSPQRRGSIENVVVQTAPRKMSSDGTAIPSPRKMSLGDIGATQAPPPPPTAGMLTHSTSATSLRKMSELKGSQTSTSAMPPLPLTAEQLQQQHAALQPHKGTSSARGESKLRMIGRRNKAARGNSKGADDAVLPVFDHTVSAMASIQSGMGEGAAGAATVMSSDDDGSAAVAAGNAICGTTVCEDIHDAFKDKSTFTGIFKLEKSILEGKLFSRTLPALELAQIAAQDVVLEDRLLHAVDLHRDVIKLAASLGATVVRTQTGLISRLINGRHSAHIDHKKALESLRTHVVDILARVIEPMHDNILAEGSVNVCLKAKGEIEKMNITGPELVNKVIVSVPEAQRGNVMSSLITNVANRGADLMAMTSCLISTLCKIPFFYVPNKQPHQLQHMQTSSSLSSQQFMQYVHHQQQQQQAYSIDVPLWEITTYAYRLMDIVVSIASEFLTAKFLQDLHPTSPTIDDISSPPTMPLDTAGEGNGNEDDEDSGDMKLWDEVLGKGKVNASEMSDGFIRAISLNNLIATITPHTPTTPGILAMTKVAIRTISTYTTPKKFLNKLIERFNVPKLNSVLAVGIRNRVLIVLEQFIEAQYDTLDESTLKALEDFIQGPLAGFDPAASRKIKYNLDSKISIMRQRAAAAQAPSMEIPLYPGSRTPMEHFLEGDELVIAQQLTMISLKIFTAIQPKELLDQAWIKPKLQYRAPNVVLFQERTALLSRFIGILIMSKATAEERAEVMNKVLRIMGHLLKLNNFNDLMALYAGFVIASVNRLNVTKGLIDPKCQKMLKYCDKALAPLKSFKQYRSLLEESSGSIIPILSVTLNDLTFVDEGNPDCVNGLINFEKRVLMFDIIGKIQNYQRSSYNFPIVEPLHSILCALPTCTDAVLYDYSLVREPRGGGGWVSGDLSQTVKQSSRKQAKLAKTLR